MLTVLTVFEKTDDFVQHAFTCSLIVNVCCTIGPTGSTMNKHTYTVLGSYHSSLETDQ